LLFLLFGHVYLAWEPEKSLSVDVIHGLLIEARGTIPAQVAEVLHSLGFPETVLEEIALSPVKGSCTIISVLQTPSHYDWNYIYVPHHFKTNFFFVF